MRKTLLLAAASTLVSLLVLECVFRIAGVSGDYHRPRVDVAYPVPGETPAPTPYGLYSHSVIVSQYDSDPRGYFEPGNRVSHVQNSVGWRDHEHTLDKPDGVFRILGLGDSYLWGQGVKREDICLSKLEGLLENAVPGKRIETINAGLSALNTTAELALLRGAGLAYDPDLVIVHFVLNDVELDVFRPGKKIEFYVDYTNIYNSTDWLSSVSYLWSWGRQRIVNSARSRRYVDECIAGFTEDSPGWKASREALSGIKAECDGRGVQLLVVVFPFFYELDGVYPFQPIHEAIVRYCREHGIRVLDLRSAYSSYHGPELWVHPSDQHPNEIAHDVAAQAIAKFLREDASPLVPTAAR